jgi:hypothetical protein
MLCQQERADNLRSTAVHKTDFICIFGHDRIICQICLAQLSKCPECDDDLILDEPQTNDLSVTNTEIVHITPLEPPTKHTNDSISDEFRIIAPLILETSAEHNDDSISDEHRTLDLSGKGIEIVYFTPLEPSIDTIREAEPQPGAAKLKQCCGLVLCTFLAAGIFAGMFAGCVYYLRAHPQT